MRIIVISCIVPYYSSPIYSFISIVLCIAIPYSGFISLGTNFPERSVLSFSRNFPDLEIYDPRYQNTHMSEISHKVYGYT